MKQAEHHAKVRHAVRIEGLSERVGSAAVQDQPENDLEDVEVLAVTGLPAQLAAGADEARSIHRNHRSHSGRRQTPAKGAATYAWSDCATSRL